jgi:hypothetical protein
MIIEIVISYIITYDMIALNIMTRYDGLGITLQYSYIITYDMIASDIMTS